MQRSYIKELKDKVGERVKISGWVDVRRDHGKLIFINLRDSTGKIQVVAGPDLADKLRSEWVISVEGEIKKRPTDMVNPDIELGDLEISADKIEVLNESKTPPFDLGVDGYDVNEETRLKYRYLDLRRTRLQKNLRMRHKVIQFFRNYLTEKGFAEIETPLLTKSTPEGARDYVVPSRLYPGKFYALPQSPQQYKQLLMVAGFEKYFQIARALRDEDTRGDRQPEHTQIDIEMSFIEPEDVMSLTENMITAMMKELYPDKKMKTPWPCLNYHDSMEKYGTDKPDLRENKDDPNEIAFVWIVNFPSFEKDKQTGDIQPVHHMFVQPREDSVKLIDTEPLKMISTQYDWVCNGYELASGSIRIIDPQLQMKVFKLLGMSEEKAKQQFGHLLEAFTYGAPPHGGIAPGIDRLIMILQNEPNIREVIAFPKTGDARDPMMKSPDEISKEQLKELGIEIKKK
jgi:aspartyl-tRNA synthetase